MGIENRSSRHDALLRLCDRDRSLRRRLERARVDAAYSFRRPIETATEKRLAARSGGGAHGGSASARSPGSSTTSAAMRSASKVDFASVAVGPDGHRRALPRASMRRPARLDWGQTATYGEIARRLGMADPRDVGQALSRNPIPIIIPCHRVVASGGKLGGFSALWRDADEGTAAGPGGRRRRCAAAARALNKTGETTCSHAPINCGTPGIRCSGRAS